MAVVIVVIVLVKVVVVVVVVVVAVVVVVVVVVVAVVAAPAVHPVRQKRKCKMVASWGCSAGGTGSPPRRLMPGYPQTFKSLG